MRANSIAALALTAAALAVAPAHASSVLSGTPSLLHGTPREALSGTSAGAGSTTLLDSVGFISGKQIFSDAVNVPVAGTLTVKLAGISWLDALQNLNCFVTAPGGGIVGNANNGLTDTVEVQPGTLYVNWYAQAGSPLFLGAYSLSVNFQPNAPPPPVPLPPALLLLLSGLGALALVLRRPRSAVPAG